MQHPVTGKTPLFVYRVADLVVDRPRGRVTRDGVELPVPRLSFDVLLALIEAAPALVTIDDLMSRVWAGVVVSPETVAHRIKLLRSALGEDAHHPRYLAVVRGRGYRLVAPVVRIAEATCTATDSTDPVGATDAAPPPPAPAIHPTTRAPRSIALALAFAAVLGIAMIAWTRLADDRRVAPARVALATADRSIAVLPFENVGTLKADESLATGVAEAVLHRLAGLPEMTVIARASSFALGARPDDVRRIGRQLGARFLLAGSVQRDAGRLRVTAQLIDSESGTQLWSLQLDRAARDVFAVQDEIAAKVAQALRVSLQPAGTGAGSAPRDFDAYLEYLQARSLLGSSRVANLAPAVEALTRAIRLDPEFAPAYVALATAHLQLAEFDAGPGRRARLDDAIGRAGGLLARAMQLEPANAEALLVRARALAFTDLAAAERDYRAGLRLAPSDAAGYEGLAGVVYQDARRRDEALVLLDRARRLSPLEPRYDVTKAVFLLYGRSDVAGSEALLQEALGKDPLFPSALARLGELYWSCRARPAEGIRYLEQALALDPGAEWTRRVLVMAYLDVGDEAAARDVIARAPTPVAVRALPLALYRGEWRRAADLAYEAFDAATITGVDEGLAVLAIRHDARTERSYFDAVELLEEAGGVTWDAAGQPVVESRLDLKSAVVGLVDVLARAGDGDRSRRLLERVGKDMEFEARQLGRGDLWYGRAQPLLRRLRGDDAGAVAELARYAELGFLQHQSAIMVRREPEFDGLRSRPDFLRLLAMLDAWEREQRRLLDEYRAAGRVPVRPAGRR